MSDNIISNHISLGIIIFLGIGFVVIWRNTDFLGFWSAFIFLIILVIAWILFF